MDNIAGENLKRASRVPLRPLEFALDRVLGVEPRPKGVEKMTPYTCPRCGGNVTKGEDLEGNVEFSCIQCSSIYWDEIILEKEGGERRARDEAELLSSLKKRPTARKRADVPVKDHHGKLSAAINRKRKTPPPVDAEKKQKSVQPEKRHEKGHWDSLCAPCFEQGMMPSEVAKRLGYEKAHWGITRAFKKWREKSLASSTSYNGDLPGQCLLFEAGVSEPTSPVAGLKRPVFLTETDREHWEQTQQPEEAGTAKSPRRKKAILSVRVPLSSPAEGRLLEEAATSEISLDAPDSPFASLKPSMVEGEPLRLALSGVDPLGALGKLTLRDLSNLPLTEMLLLYMLARERRHGGREPSIINVVAPSPPVIPPFPNG